MPCPTCDHTVQCLTCRPESPANDVFWCPRCGTILMGHMGDTGIPKLVERCRAFREEFWANETPPIWDRLGIAESINIPAERK